MLNLLKTTAVAAGLALGLAWSAQAQPAPEPLAAFDVHQARGWADRLVLCDYTAFLAGQPDLSANRMWVRRDDGHSDLLLPPEFVGGGQWYKEGYQRLYFKLLRRGELTHAQLRQAQDSVGRDLIESYRRHRPGLAGGSRFLARQDHYCRDMAREQGEVIT